jgi:hypothetical protein
VSRLSNMAATPGQFIVITLLRTHITVCGELARPEAVCLLAWPCCLCERLQVARLGTAPQHDSS